jgi:hypothetical protein
MLPGSVPLEIDTRTASHQSACADLIPECDMFRTKRSGLPDIDMESNIGTWPVGSSEMTGPIPTLDWTSTPLCPIFVGPRNLRITVDPCLGTPHPWPPSRLSQVVPSDSAAVEFPSIEPAHLEVAP